MRCSLVSVEKEATNREIQGLWRQETKETEFEKEFSDTFFRFDSFFSLSSLVSPLVSLPSKQERRQIEEDKKNREDVQETGWDVTLFRLRMHLLELKRQTPKKETLLSPLAVSSPCLVSCLFSSPFIFFFFFFSPLFFLSYCSFNISTNGTQLSPVSPYIFPSPSLTRLLLRPSLTYIYLCLQHRKRSWEYKTQWN